MRFTSVFIIPPSSSHPWSSGDAISLEELLPGETLPVEPGRGESEIRNLAWHRRNGSGTGSRSSRLCSAYSKLMRNAHTYDVESVSYRSNGISASEERARISISGFASLRPARFCRWRMPLSVVIITSKAGVLGIWEIAVSQLGPTAFTGRFRSRFR